MDVTLPIYKADDITVLLDKSEFSVTTAEDCSIISPAHLDAGTTYEFVIDFLTTADYYIDMYIGSTLAVSFDVTGQEHRTVTRTYAPVTGTNNVKLRLMAGGSTASAHIRSFKILTRVTHGTDDPRYVAEKWEFNDTVMGERSITFTANSPYPIDWHVNDWLIFRGQRFYLNYVPSCTQSGGEGDKGDSFTYESIRFEDEQGKLPSCMILDITPTTGDYVAALGTNYTGSSVFTIYCARTTVTMVDGSGAEVQVTLSPVEYVGGIIQSNLNRLYPTEGWRVQVNPQLPYLDDKVLSFNKMYVPDALKLIHDTWDVDFIVIGRTIKIGYTLNNITEDGNGDILTFGYGEGYNTVSSDGKALFKIKRTANSSQKLITRLRAMGSTRNMPYRYYNNKYELPQTMFVANLQLPDTFAAPDVKATNNALRDITYGIGDDGYPNLRHVLGDSNDAYIDKHDDAANCPDGIREGAAFWDGSDSNLEEIYPTIQNGTYLDLRSANVPDMDGRVPSVVGPQNAYPNYGDQERIDEILGVDEQTTNIGDGVMADADVISEQAYPFSVETQSRTEQTSGVNWSGVEVELYTLNVEQSPGTYMIAPTTQNVIFRLFVNTATQYYFHAGFQLDIIQIPTDGSASSVVRSYRALDREVPIGENYDMAMPTLPSSNGSFSIKLTKRSKVKFTIRALVAANVSNPPATSITWRIMSKDAGVEPHYVWRPTDATDLIINQPFYLYIKDMGIDMRTLQTTGEDAIIHFNTGQCGGMEFKFNPNTVEEITVGNKKGWKLTITERFHDDTLHVYYPNMYSRIEAGDQYVLLNIEFPEIYIKLAEIRLLNAATKYLADNCETKFIYEPEVDDIYLQQNIDRCEAAGDITKSIWYNIYAGYKFSMRGIPDAPGALPPLVDNITIKTVTIKMGEKVTPVVEMTLNNDIEQSIIQKLTTSVDRIYNGSFSFNGGIGGASRLSQLTDTLINTLSPYQVLEWSGDIWKNADAVYYYDADSQSDGWLTLYHRTTGYDLLDFTHTHAFEDIVELPGTLGGMGINANDPLFALATAGYANALKTSRSLWGNPFDGTADVSGPITITNGSHSITLSVDSEGWLCINGNVYANGSVSSLGRQQ